MSHLLVAFGILLWVMFGMITFLYFSPHSISLANKFIYMLSFKGLKKTGAELGVSSLQLTGLVWVVTGVIGKITNGKIFEGDSGTLLLIVVFLSPVALGAVLADRRK